MKLTRTEKQFLLEVLRDRKKQAFLTKANGEVTLKEGSLRPSERLRVAMNVEEKEKDEKACDEVIAKLLSSAAA